MAIYRLGSSPVGVRQLVYNAPTSQAWLDGCPWSALQSISSYGSTGYVYYANDFLRWEGPTAASAAPGTAGWIYSETAAGAGDAQLIDVLDSQTNGVLRLLTDNGDNDTITLQLNGSPFTYTAGKEMWFGIRCTSNDVNDGELFFGLALEGDTDVFSTFPTDGLFFEKAETATAMDFHARKNGTSSESTGLDTTAMVDDTFHTYGFHVKKSGAIDVVYDDSVVATVAAGNDNLPDDEDLSLYLAVQTGSTDQTSLDVDWVFVAAER